MNPALTPPAAEGPDSQVAAGRWKSGPEQLLVSAVAEAEEPVKLRGKR